MPAMASVLRPGFSGEVDVINQSSVRRSHNKIDIEGRNVEPCDDLLS